MHHTPDRRSVLMSWATALFIGTRTFHCHAYEPIKRIGGSRLRTSLNAFSFLELLNANAADPSKGIDLFGVCNFCATEGFDAVDLTGYFSRGIPRYH